MNFSVVLSFVTPELQKNIINIIDIFRSLFFILGEVWVLFMTSQRASFKNCVFQLTLSKKAEEAEEAKDGLG